MRALSRCGSQLSQRWRVWGRNAEEMKGDVLRCTYFYACSLWDLPTDIRYSSPSWWGLRMQAFLCSWQHSKYTVMWESENWSECPSRFWIDLDLDRITLEITLVDIITSSLGGVQMQEEPRCNWCRPGTQSSDEDYRKPVWTGENHPNDCP